MKKVFLFTTVMLIICLIFTSCGGTKTNSDPTTTGETGQTKPEPEKTAEKEKDDEEKDFDPFGKYEPGITVTFARPWDPNADSTALLQESFNETLNDNRWTELFKEKLGITVVNELTAQGGDQYDQKIKLAMTSSGLPEFVRIGNLSDVKNLVEAGVAIELGEVYENYASPLFREITEMEGKNIFDMATFDGKIYGIPLKQTSTDAYSHLWIRQDWLDKLDLQRPKTMTDVMDLARAFVEKDPDGNGKDDTYGLMLDKNFLWQSKGVFWAYGAYPNSPSHWISDNDGKRIYATVQPEMKEGLRFLRDLYAEGLIDHEFAAKDFDKAFELVANGKIGMFYGPHWNAWPIDNVIKNDSESKWVAITLPTEDGSPIRIPVTVASSGVVIATDKATHPEALIKLFNVYVDKLFSDDKDAESAKYMADGGYEFWGLPPIHALHPMLDLQSHRDIKKAISDGTTDLLTGNAKDFYQFMEDGIYPWELMFGPEDTPFVFVDSSYPDQVIWNEYNSAPTSTMANRWSNMEELINTTFVKIVTGGLDLDSGFDNMVNEWYKMGGEQVTQEVNELKN